MMQSGLCNSSYAVLIIPGTMLRGFNSSHFASHIEDFIVVCSRFNHLNQEP